MSNLILIIVLVLIALDTIAYSYAKYPERTKWYYTFLPFGGTIALIKFGRGNKYGL